MHPKQAPQKVLLVRFSSIGDIVLTTPIVRTLALAYPSCELHYLTKAAYAPLLADNPYLHKLHLLQDSWQPLLAELQAEGFDYVLDLHKNLRSLRVRLALWQTPVASFPKLNLQKWLLTRLGWDTLPDTHIVERYAQTLAPFGLQVAPGGLDFHWHPAAEIAVDTFLEAQGWHQPNPIAIVLGGKFATKKWPAANHAALLRALGKPAILVGGPDEAPDAAELRRHLPADYPVLDATGKLGLQASAALLNRASWVLAHDTGYMHIAAALQKPMFVLWGNTVPKFGMYPYQSQHYNLEVSGLDCRPCSKLGHTSCPRHHFRCMRELTAERVELLLRKQAIAWQLPGF